MGLFPVYNDTCLFTSRDIGHFVHSIQCLASQALQSLMFFIFKCKLPVLNWGVNHRSRYKCKYYLGVWGFLKNCFIGLLGVSLTYVLVEK